MKLNGIKLIKLQRPDINKIKMAYNLNNTKLNFPQNLNSTNLME